MGIMRALCTAQLVTQTGGARRVLCSVHLLYTGQVPPKRNGAAAYAACLQRMHERARREHAEYPGSIQRAQVVVLL